MVVLRENLREVQSDIFEASLIASLKWLESEWSKFVSDPVLTCQFTDRFGADKQRNERDNRQRDKPFPLPNCDLLVVTFAVNNQGYNKFALQQLGAKKSFMCGKGLFRKEHLVPIDVGIGLQFEGSNIEETHAFSQLWQRLWPNKTVIIRQNATNAKYKIQLNLDEQVSVPQRGENDYDTMFVETTLILKTYTGISVMRPTAKKMNLQYAKRNFDEKWVFDTFETERARKNRIEA